VEIKNLNSFRFMERALAFEIERQVALTRAGGQVEQETVGWNEAEGHTYSQRSKEDAHDYRYFPEPDLPPLNIDPGWIERVRAKLPELPEARRDRFMAQYGLQLYDANLLTETKDTAEYFESSLKLGDASPAKAKAVANWMLGEFSRLMNASNTDITTAKIMPADLCHLIDLVQKGNISGTSAKQVFEEMFKSGRQPDEIVKQQGLDQINDSSEIESAVAQIIASNPQPVADYKAGKTQAIKFLVGQIMKATKGRANANTAQEMLIKMIEGK
jgi:aspartyl-tRNA(Asn)/glutamyl-tRNA(Gln) amidotransferase subunit B